MLLPITNKRQTSARSRAKSQPTMKGTLSTLVGLSVASLLLCLAFLGWDPDETGSFEYNYARSPSFQAFPNEANKLSHQNYLRLLESAVEEEPSDRDAQNYAVFLISFGEEAAASTYVERSIMSIRRRGAFRGAVVLLTDAPSERYDGLFDENVYILHPNPEHIKEDYFDYGEMNFKRFKTYVIDYVDSLDQLSDVEWIYYIDIDVLVGAPFLELAEKLETTYNMTDVDDQVSKLYFFENEWPQYVLQGGFFVIHRRTSAYCLDLWREEIDSRPDEKMDQVSLNAIVANNESGAETRCQLIKMDTNREIIWFPRKDFHLTLMMRNPSFPYLIHIKNTSQMISFQEEVHEKFVGTVLELSASEMESNSLTKKTFFSAAHHSADSLE